MDRLRYGWMRDENLSRIEDWLRGQGIDVTPREVREAAFREILAGEPADTDVFVFGYGSLLWNPACRVAETIPATLHGYHRSFCLSSPFGRGTPETPGLMLALEPGGSCTGVALRIAAVDRETELGSVWTREMITGAYRARWVRLTSAAGALRALTFVANPASPRYVGRPSAAVAAHHLARAEGPLGTSRAYLEALVHQLDALGLADRAMRRLHRDVGRLRGSPPAASRTPIPATQGRAEEAPPRTRRRR